MALAKFFYYSTKFFAEGNPIDDVLGPMVVDKLVRDVSNNGEIETHEISKDLIIQKANFEDRIIYVVRAKDPGGTVENLER